VTKKTIGLLSGLLVLVGSISLIFILSTLPKFRPSPDLDVAFKGAAGETMFRVNEGKGIASEPGAGGLDQLLAPAKDGTAGDGILTAYERDPEKYKRYANLFDTATNALKIGQLVQRNPATYEYPLNSVKIHLPPAESLDAWHHPYCLEQYDSGVAVVSGGPAVESFDCKQQKTTPAEINGAGRPIFVSSTGEVVVIVKEALGSGPRRLNKNKGALSRSPGKTND